jgi:hypothetical protein
MVHLSNCINVWHGSEKNRLLLGFDGVPSVGGLADEDYPENAIYVAH